MPITKAAPKRKRDDFKSSVLLILYKRSGARCCKCRAPTFGPMSNDLNKSVNIGKGAHITAASVGGPRFDPKMTPEVRSSASNGMWMCSNCHDLIDRDVGEYPVARLRSMKQEAEKKAKEEMGVVPPASERVDPLSNGVSAIAIIEVRKAKARVIAINGESIDYALGEDLLEMVAFINPQIDSYLSSVGRELIMLYDQLAAHCTIATVLMEVLRRIKILADTYHRQWEEADVEQASSVCKKIVSRAPKGSKVYQSGVAFLKDLSSKKTYSGLTDKSFHALPLRALRELRSVDLVDGEPDAKRACTMAGGPPPLITASDDDTFLDLMEQLSQCDNESEAMKIEQRLIDLGFDTEVN